MVGVAGTPAAETGGTAGVSGSVVQRRTAGSQPGSGSGSGSGSGVPHSRACIDVCGCAGVGGAASPARHDTSTPPSSGVTPAKNDVRNDPYVTFRPPCSHGSTAFADARRAPARRSLNRAYDASSCAAGIASFSSPDT